MSASVSRTRPGWDAYFMGIARAISTRMSCDRAQIGCVIVSPDHRILSGGYGGAPSGWPSCDEVGHMMAEMASGDGMLDNIKMEQAITFAEINRRYPQGELCREDLKSAYLGGRDSKPSRQSCIRTVHAEENAVCTAARHGVALGGSTLYTTASCCWDCLKMVAQAGIVRIVYGELYSSARSAGMDIVAIARERGIAMECLPAPAAAVDDGVGFSTKGIDSNGELEVELSVHGTKDSCYLSREFVEALLTEFGVFAPPSGYTCMGCGAVGPAEHEHGCGGTTLKAS